MRNSWLVAAGISGAVAVGMGAYGAHGLSGTLVSLGHSESEVQARISERFEPAVLYHLVHSLALAIVALLVSRQANLPLKIAGGAFAAGILLFSGLLYVLTFRDVPVLGAIIPIGGLAYIVGWIALAVGGRRSPSDAP